MKNLLLTFLCLGFACTAFAQTTITGNVTESNGEAVIGATVLEQGTTNGTITDIDGNFSLSVSSPDATLAFSYIGYQNQNIALNGRTNIKVVMKEDANVLQEVVAVGYGKVKKSDATGAVTAIKPDELNKGLMTSPQDALMGKVAGVNVSPGDGTPGGGATIRIRGGSSLNASNDPLIVVDGLVLDNNGIQGVANPLSTINPNDIETFTILKDASATAIYGSRASNGVIIITTKKGAANSKPKFTYNGNVSVSNLVKRVEVLNASELKKYAQFLEINKLDYMGDADTDWQKQIYRAAIGTDHNFTVAGGAKNMPYRVSLGLTYQDGIIKTSNMHRGTLSVSLNPVLFDKHLTLNVNARASYIGNRFADGDVVGASIAMDPTQSIYGPDLTQRQKGEDGSNYGGYYQHTNAANYGDPAWLTTYNTQAVRNPVATLNQKNDRSKAYELVGNIEADYSIHKFEDLHLHINMGGNYANGTQTTIIDKFSASNHYWGWDGTTNKHKYTLNFTAYAQYLKDFAKTQHIDVMAGYEYAHYMKGKGTEHGYGIYPETSTQAGDKYNEKNVEFANQLYIASLFGRLNYNAWNRYLLTVTFRADASSYFHPDKRWGLFPSVALAWKIKEEKFLQNVKWLNELKLRIGWGVTGQQEINQGDAPYQAIYDPSKNGGYYTLGEIDPVTGEYIYYSTDRPRVINKAITWEKTTTYNAGLDFGFLKGRISGSVDFYHRITNDLINTCDVLAGTNFKNRVVANVGSLANTGVELTLNATAIDKRDFKWDISFNGSYNKNRIIDITLGGETQGAYIWTGDSPSAGNGGNVQVHKEGYPASSFYVYETKKDENGNWYFVDRDKDGNINDNDLYCYKKAAPDFIMGLSTTFTIKKFDISIAFRANIGNYMYNDVLSGSLRNLEKSNLFATKIGGYVNVTKQAYNTYYGVDGYTKFQSAGLTEYHKSDFFVQNASFLRCDKITVGYTFTKPNIRIFATVQNPFVITGYKGLDPEQFDGVDNNIYPRSMVSMIGLTYNF